MVTPMLDSGGHWVDRIFAVEGMTGLHIHETKYGFAKYL